MSKIIAITGITGTQGGSVASFFLNEPGWTVRGISRDPGKASAKQWITKGVEMMAGDFDDVESLKKAFQGACVIFGNTDWAIHFNDPAIHDRARREGRTPHEVAFDREVEQGKNLVDAAATVHTLERFVLSTLNSARELSKGKITTVYHFDGKWEIVKYSKEKHAELWEKTNLLQLGVFMSNWTFTQKPRKQEDGTYKFSFPMRGDTKFPMVDAHQDTGLLVKALVELEPGKNVMGAGSYLSWNDWAQIWGRVNEVTCKYEQEDRKIIKEKFGGYGQELADMFAYMDEFGYDGDDPDVIYPWNLGVDVRTTPIEKYIEQQDWSSVF